MFLQMSEVNVTKKFTVIDGGRNVTHSKAGSPKPYPYQYTDLAALGFTKTNSRALMYAGRCEYMPSEDCTHVWDRFGYRWDAEDQRLNELEEMGFCAFPTRHNRKTIAQ